MCGIAGGFSDTLNEQNLSSAIASVGRRGPDANGVFLSGKYGLAHCRLSIIDLRAESNQPMTSRSGKTVIVFNGEIYNYRELAAKYNLKLRTSSDTEVFLELFEAYGVTVLDELNGMFAAAFYHSESNCFTLIRDRTGKKPLFWYQKGNNFFFASELKAIRELTTALTFNAKTSGLFLHLGFIPAPFTVYNEVHKLPAGGILTFTPGKKIQISQWYAADQKIGAVLNISEGEALEELEKLLRSSVKYRMISDVPFGSFLSGGIDSSLITALAADISGDQLKTFTIGFNDAKYDESKYARKVAQHLGTKHEEFILTEKDALDNIEHVMDYFDEPFADSSALPSYLICKMAKTNATMAISGEGGDELFMGYGAYKWAERISNPFLRETGRVLAPLVNAAGPDRFRRAWQMFNRESCPESLIFSQEQYLFSQTEINHIVKKELSGEEFRFNPEVNRVLSPKERQEVFDLSYYLTDDLLVKMDRASMMNAVEVRCPFLDYRLVEFAMNLPEELKVKNGEPKYLLKKLLYKFYPKELFQRPKQGFSVPLERWLRSDLRFLIQTYLSEDAINKTGVLDASSVKRLVSQFEKGTGYLYNRIWALIILQRWLIRNRYAG
jgi:asparagine synthase (glutamine-hydrolysing)